MESYGLDGLPIDFLAAGELLGDLESRRVALTRLLVSGMPVEISTVFLSVDHAPESGEHLPVLWETRVSGFSEHDGSMIRYTSRAAAEQGHADVVKRVRADHSDAVIETVHHQVSSSAP